MKNDQTYIPGMCNINTAEVARRRQAMVIGLLVATVLFLGLLLFGVNIYFRAAIVFLPLLIGVIGYFQVRNRFCVAYAAQGMQNASDDIDEVLAITEKNAKEADKRKARKIYAQTFVVVAVITLLSLFVPAL